MDAPLEHTTSAWRQPHMIPPPLLFDADIRPALKGKLLAAHRNEPDTVLLDELGVCRGEVRVDVVLVNGLIHGYEIKSDYDSLRRLPGQIELYNKVLDRATLVAGERHVEEAAAILPEWWGVLSVEATRLGPRFKTFRRARKNPARDARALAELLWLDDAMELLERHKLDRGVRGKPRRVVWDHICKNLDIDVIASAVRTNLKARTKPPARP